MAHVKERTRTRTTPSLAMEDEASSKRRKVIINQHNLKFNNSTSSSTSSGAPVAEERCSSPISDESPASCCSSNGSFCLDEKINKFSDPEVESTQVETSTCHSGEKITRREMSLRTNSQEVESSMEKKKMKNKPAILSTQQKMPTESELEEFFSATEKDIQKRFQHKYNYDIVKDVPLEGRYEWVQLKP